MELQPPPPPDFMNEAARREKRVISLSLIWGGETVVRP